MYVVMVVVDIVLFVASIFMFVIPEQLAEFSETNLLIDTSDVGDFIKYANDRHDEIYITVVSLGAVFLIISILNTIMTYRMSILIGWKYILFIFRRYNEILLLILDFIITLPGVIALLVGVYTYDTAKTITAPIAYLFFFNYIILNYYNGFILFVIGVVILFIVIINLFGRLFKIKYLFDFVAIISGCLSPFLLIFGI